MERLYLLARRLGLWGFLILFPVITAFGQTGKISGVVTDAESGDPLPGVNIVLENTEQGAATDANGNYFIINITPGNYSLSASMIGYAKITKTDVLVSTNHTTPVDFSLSLEAIAGEAITVEAEREIVEMDKSASEISVTANEINEVTNVTSLQEFINSQAGVQGMQVRGGSLDQTQFMVDGLLVVDNRANTPMVNMVNLSSVQELEIIKGGFNAEYGNVRSGLLNVVTKEGSPTRYSGSINARFTPPQMKHNGPSLFDPNNYYLRPYLDPAVMWVGTENGTWDDETKKQYNSFVGWNAISEKLLADDDPTNDRTPEEARDLFLWNHRVQGVESLGRAAGSYGDKPDWDVDAGLGGPVPGLSKALGDLTFFGSYKNKAEQFGLETSRNYYREQNTHLKLTSRVSNNLKVRVEGLYGVINTVNRQPGGSFENYLSGGADIFNSSLATGDEYGHTAGGVLYSPYALNPFDLYRSMEGFSIDHVLSPGTFYKLTVSHIQTTNSVNGPGHWRDTTTIRMIGNTPVDEAPLGYRYDLGQETMVDGMKYGAEPTAYDHSTISTINAKFDLTSQIDNYNQIKAGWMVNYDGVDAVYGTVRYGYPGDDWENAWTAYPMRAGGYVQDKLEFEGMIANFGVRLDYNNPNTNWFTVDRYSEYFQKNYMDTFQDLAPTETSKGHLKISPRLGVSHPISERAKLYFNYGHFYSMPPTRDMYEIRTSNWNGLTFIGNPSAELPRTVAYELGLDQNIGDLFSLHIAGYYKDISDQASQIQYTNYSGSVNYSTITNQNYQDIRGFEFRLDRRFGRWVTGWINYDYMITTSGYVGRQHYYQDPRQQRLYGLYNPYQENPLARPIARANIRVNTPANWGPRLMGVKPLSNVLFSVLFQWHSGRYQTWDPLETHELSDNLHWRSTYNFDARLRKLVRVGQYNFSLYADIHNLFDNRFISTQGFSNSDDMRNYLESLHLPMYAGQEYQDKGFTPGNDRPGDIKSKDKPYIDMPDRGFLTFLDPRIITFGLLLDF